jgi:N,N-dimethylformamidase
MPLRCASRTDTLGSLVLIGYVSDERYVAIPDALVEIKQHNRFVAAVRSTAGGALYADIEPGTYRVTLAKDGFGSKRVDVTLTEAKPYQFRLLSNNLAGYVWPKWVKSGEGGDFRVHSIEPFRLSLWRYGRSRQFVKLLGWHDEHGPQAMMQITPDGDYTQTGVEWNRRGYSNPHINQLVRAPGSVGPLLLSRRDGIREVLRLSMGSGPFETRRADRSTCVNKQLECLQQLGRTK